MAWLVFDGTAVQVPPDRWRLIPHNEPDAAIEMNLDDVRLARGFIHVREGARALRIDVLPTALTRTSPMVQSAKQFSQGRSRCLGGLECCCDNELVGPCNGRWDDC
jgi:hypothetical protein